MSSLIWLLLYLAPLLGLTAALFAWFGWQWRGSDMQRRIDALNGGSDMQRRIDALNAQLEKAQAALRQAEAARADPTVAAPALSEPVATPALPDPAAAAELQALRDEVKSARAEARLRQDEAAKAHEAAQALEAELARVTAEMEELRAAHFAAQAELDHLRNAPPLAPPSAAEEAATAPDKPKRKRSTPAKPKAAKAASTGTLRDKIAALETQLSAHQTGLATLTQERDDWQRRIRKLEAQTLADPAGMALAHRSLADSEKRLATATSEIDHTTFFDLPSYPGPVSVPVDVKNAEGVLVTKAQVRLWISLKPEKKK